MKGMRNSYCKKISIPENQEFLVQLTKEELVHFQSKFMKYIKIIKYESIDKEKFTIKCKTRFYVGLITLPNHLQLEISPKFPNSQYLAMLTKSDPKNIIFFRDFNTNITQFSFFDVLNSLIKDFLENVFKTLSKHLYKSYHAKITYSEKLTGKLLLESSFQSPLFLLGKFRSEVDEFSINNRDNQIIKYTIEQIMKLTQLDHKDFLNIHKIYRYLVGVTFRKFSSTDKRYFVYTKQNNHYRKVHQYCWFFLDHFLFGKSPGLSDGYGFLFNSWDIYEKFLRAIIKDYLPNYDVQKGHPQLKMILPKLQGQVKNEPDIVICRNFEIIMCLDAKYKENYNFREDAGQMMRYLRAFSLLHDQNYLSFKPKERKGCLIYPKLQSSANSADFKPKTYDIGHSLYGDIYYIRIDLSRILEQDYLKDWVENLLMI